MEQTVNKDQDPPHGGSFVRKPDGSLQLVEGTEPVTAATAAPATDPEPQPAASGTSVEQKE